MVSLVRQQGFLVGIVGIVVIGFWVYPTPDFVANLSVQEQQGLERAFSPHDDGVSASSSFIANEDSRPPPDYPLEALNLSSAREYYQKGFWQRMAPVPLKRWTAVDNTTCILPNNNTSNNAQYYSSLQEWQRRVPSIILIGTQKGGSTALAYYLYNHPKIQYLPTKELHYFDEEMDKTSVHPDLDNNNNNNNNDNDMGGIYAAESLEYYQQTVIGQMIPLKKLQLETQVALDATPNYMFASDRVPHRIFCTTPWVKLLVLLRNPIDRAFSQYNMQFNRDLANPQTRRGCSTFEDHVELDMQVLEETGVVQDWTQVDFEQFSGSPQELIAWRTYTKLGLNSPVGRGLYALQLRHWLQTMDLYNKSRSEDLLVIPSETLKRNTNGTYARILRFLGLRPHQMMKYGSIHNTNYRTLGMNPETRKKLQDFYQPYNRQLEALLDPSWQRIWEG